VWASIQSWRPPWKKKAGAISRTRRPKPGGYHFSTHFAAAYPKSCRRAVFAWHGLSCRYHL